MKGVFMSVARFVLIVISIAFIFSIVSTDYTHAATVKFRIIAANPSQTRTQRVPIKVYLPEEVKTSDIIDSGGLELEFDSEKSLYYVYRNNMVLKPKEIRAFEVEINDIWVIPPDSLDNSDKRIDYLIKAFEGSEYHDRATTIKTEFETLASEIVKTQTDENLTRSQHIGVYRTNKKAFAALKSNIKEMEDILDRERGPLAPELLTKTKFATESPTKTATWIIVFFTWYRQSKATDKTLSQAKKSSFLDLGAKDKKDETSE